MRNPGLIFKSAGGFASVIIAILFCYASLAADLPVDSKPAAVDAARYADFMANEVLDLQDLAEGADVQRRMFDRMTPPGFSWFQPMFPAVVPFVAANFDEPFLSALLGEDRNSVAVYPLALALNPKTRETLVYNVEEKLIATIPADKAFRYWPGDVDPARVTLQLDLLPMEDVEKYLYTEGRIAEIAGSASLGSAKISRKGGAAKRSLGASEFGICNIQHLTNGNFRLTVTNGDQTAEIFAYTVWHTSSVVVVTWTNEQSNVVTDTNTLWTPVSPPYNGWESEWDCLATNLLLTNGVGIWDNTSISSNARVRFYAAAHSADADGDRLTDGAEKFVYHTDPNEIDTDEDGLLDGFDIAIGIGDARYALWATNGIVYFENNGTRTFKGELTADTSPLNSDTDSDGLPDGWEVQNGLDATDANGNNGPDGDPDDDSFDNELELELGAPANNAAWNGNQLAYRLTHVHTVMVTNPLPATNQIGMRVDIEKSADCGGTAGTQNVTDDFNVPALLECGYYINITVEGSVEDVDTNYDMVSFEAYTNTPYFQGHYNRPKECRMVGDSAMRNILILANNSVHLRYDTVSYKWHSGAYCEITEATNTGPYRVVISGDDSICLGDPVSFSANGAAGPPYTWNGSGVSVGTNGVVTGLSPGFATVTASDSGGCTGEKKVLVLKPDIGTVANLADRTLHPGADRKPISLPQTLPSVWAGQMEFTISGALAYWAPTGGTPFTTAAFSNAQLPQTIYLEGDGCGTGNATFTIDGPPGCGTNTPIHVFGVNATLDGITEQDEESPGGFIADSTTHTNAPRTLLTLDACGSAGSSGNLVLTWDSAVVRIYTAASGGSALTQVSIPFSGFNGTNLYVEGVAPGSNTISWSYSGQADCKDEIFATVLKIDFIRDENCSGYDDSLTPPWIMVPETGNNTATAEIVPAAVANQIGFMSADTSKATVSPATASVSPQTVIVSGVAKGDTEIQAKLSGPSVACAILKTTVKERVDKTVTIHAITEENDDVQAIPVGQGQPNQTCITAGTNGVLNTTIAGDDTVSGDYITTGPDGICDTTASGDDVQVIVVGNGMASATCVGEGANNFRDTIASGDDAVSGNDINTGSDGICNTTAKATNLVPSNAPDAATLQSYLNDLFSKQANVFITVTRSDYSVNYDLDRNGGVPDPPNTGEMDAISAAAMDNTADVNMYFVNVMDAPIATTIISRHEGWIQDSHEGITEFIAAHEICHAIGRSGHSADVNDLMYSQDTGASPCNLKKNEWDMINP